MTLIYWLSFADRDMLMRYHWGMGVGHPYAWKEASTTDQMTGSLNSETNVEEFETESGNQQAADAAPPFDEDAVFHLSDHENEFLSNGGSDGDSEASSVDECEESDDEICLELDDMYGPS